MLCEPSSNAYKVTANSTEGANDGIWFQARLREAGLHNVQVQVVHLSHNQPLPLIHTLNPHLDKIVLGGTFHNVYECRPWQRPLTPWLLELQTTNIPLLGICGGHQAMAVALGGAVTKRTNGTASGSLAVHITNQGAAHPMTRHLKPAAAAPRFHFGNSDHVTTLPPSATVLATTPDSPAVALAYGSHWWSCQFHPEASSSVFQHWVDTGIISTPTQEPYTPLTTGIQLLRNFVHLTPIQPIQPIQPIKLYGVQQSLYTGKVRAYLLQRNLPFVEILATGKIYKEIIIPNAGYPVVPIICDDNRNAKDQRIDAYRDTNGPTFVQNTPDILDYLEYTYPPPSLREASLPSALTSPVQRLTCLTLEILADNFLTIHAMHYRWSFPEQRPFLAHLWGGNMVEAPHGKIVQSTEKFASSGVALGANSDTAATIEQQYLDILLHSLQVHFEIHPFLMGERPCLADYALMGPMYAHLFRDPIPGQLMALKAPRVWAWVERMNKATVNQWRPGNDHTARPEYGSDGFLAADAVPVTLLPLLNLFFRDHLPILGTAVEDLYTYCNRGGRKVQRVEVPRALGMGRGKVGKVETSMLIRTYPIWMLQRLMKEIDCCQKQRQQKASVLEWWNLGKKAHVGAGRVFEEWWEGLSWRMKETKLHRRRGLRSRGDNLWFGDGYGWMPKWLNGVVLHSEGGEGGGGGGSKL